MFAPAAARCTRADPLVTRRPRPGGAAAGGQLRPGFFGGVLTVVLKLFQLVRPDVAVFGQKDAQQLALVRQMSADLDLGVEVAAVPDVRDPDGLAVSSRNAYLSPAERSTALALSARAGGRGRGRGRRGRTAVLAAARPCSRRAATPTRRSGVDYLALVDPVTFDRVGDGYTGPALLLVAARVGATRLIDNAPVVLGGGPIRGQ